MYLEEARLSFVL